MTFRCRCGRECKVYTYLSIYTCYCGWVYGVWDADWSRAKPSPKPGTVPLWRIET
jgi:hypothetical protein